MATILNVSRKVRASGEVVVTETPAIVRRLIAVAKERRAPFITVTDDETGQEFDVRYDLVNSMRPSK